MNNKKLYKSATNKMLCGVCGGLGNYTGIDPTVIRILYAVISIFAGAVIGGIILYFILAVIIPDDDGIVD